MFSTKGDTYGTEEVLYHVSFPRSGAGENAPSAYSYAGASPYSAQGPGEITPAAYAQSYVNNTSPQASLAAYPAQTNERRELIADLVVYPWRSVRSLCQPGLRTFARETLHARWGVVWISIFVLPLLSSVVVFLLGAAGHKVTASMLGGIVLGPLIALPILFFIVQGMIWPLHVTIRVAVLSLSNATRHSCHWLRSSFWAASLSRCL